MGNSSSSSSQSNGDTYEQQSEHQQQQQQVEKKSYWKLAEEGYNELVNAIIRPPRCQYEINQLGPRVFDLCGKQFERIDFTLVNPRGLKLVCSHWIPKARVNPILPCVVYMHGNSSARLEALSIIQQVLSLGITLLSFDFSGSGMSDGEFVSLGYFEREDLKCVIEYLRDTGTTSTIALWGRSMGAATALLHGERDPSIAGMVIDSAFASLEILAEEMVDKGRSQGLFAPGFIVSMAIRFIRSTVLKKAQFDIKLLSPVSHANSCYIPALFIAANGDGFIMPSHSKKIYDVYAGDKNIILVDGDHNSARPKFMFDSVSIFLINTLQIPQAWLLSGTRSFDQQRSASSSSNAAAAAAAMDINSMNIGMTNDRQDDIRAKLYNMLGDNGKVAKATASSSSSSSSSSGSSGSISSGKNSLLSPTSIEVPSAVYSSHGSSRNSMEQMHDDSGFTFKVTEAMPSSVVVSSEWTCNLCTLINLYDVSECVACGLPRGYTAC